MDEERREEPTEEDTLEVTLVTTPTERLRRGSFSVPSPRNAY